MVTSFTDKLVDIAFGWVQCKENPATPNRSACLTELYKLYGDEPTDEAWCAVFVWTMVNETCKVFKVENKLPKTKSTTLMKERASNSGLRVDRTPAPGAIFYYARKGGGHVGIISNVEDDTLITIEGNVSNRVKFGRRDKDQHSFWFIHTEEMTTKKLIFGQTPYNAMLWIGGLAGVGLAVNKFVLKR